MTHGDHTAMWVGGMIHSISHYTIHSIMAVGITVGIIHTITITMATGIHIIHTGDMATFRTTVMEET